MKTKTEKELEKEIIENKLNQFRGCLRW